MLTQSEAIFAVSDVRRTIAFYRDILGFESQWLWQEPPTFGGVRWGKVQVMFCLQPDMHGKTVGHQHMFFSHNIQELYERHKSAGATFVSDIENKPWNVREYTVQDINGYHLRFGGPPKFECLSTATDSLPDHIRVEKRAVTYEDYATLMDSVGWNKHEPSMRDAMKQSLFFIASTDMRDGKTVGMTRASGDGRAFTIWDVIVLPEYQGQKIGSAMMEMAMIELRKIGPKGAFVGLFTGKPDFYERLGFTKDIGMHTSL